MKKLFLVHLILFIVGYANAQSDTFLNSHNIWRVTVKNNNAVIYEYAVHKITTEKYEWEQSENVWERYEDGSWQIFVDYESESVYINRRQAELSTSRTNGHIKLHDSVWQYFEETTINLNKSENYPSDSAIVKQIVNSGCKYAYEEESMIETIGGNEELHIVQNCLLEQLNLSNNERLGKLDEFIRIKDGQIILNQRFKGFEQIENL